LHPDRLSSRRVDDVLLVDGVALSSPAASSLLVPVDGGPQFQFALVPAGMLEVRPATQPDADMALYRVAGELGRDSVTWIESDAAPKAWEVAVALGRWAIAAELVAIGTRTLTEAVAYTQERRQYGRAIGTFQALQHRLASAYVSIVGASHVVAEASSTGSPWEALVAKAVAGRAAEQCCTQAQQAYGAIGFTWEHPFHRSLRRVHLLDRILGGWRELEFEIGTRLQESDGVPKVGTL
jgi:alkylation response protein AidB-like acyl-CoA dehydrogenase